MKKFDKNIAKEFKTSFGRFIAIMAIIAVGVGFLIGVMQSTPDMKKTMHDYYIENNASDLTVKGSYGLSLSDAESIKSAKEVARADFYVSTDAVVTVMSKDLVGRIVGLDSFSPDSVNRLTLQEGRFPEEGKNEVVAIRADGKLETLRVGTVVTIEDTAESTYGDIYRTEEFEVVGIVSSADIYYKDAREVSTIGTGVVDTILYGYRESIYDDLTQTPQLTQLSESSVFGIINAFTEAEEDKIAYTDCAIILKDADSKERFTDGYKNFVLEKAEVFETIGQKSSERIDEALDKMEEMAAMVGQTTEFPAASWYVLDRAGTNMSYVSFAMNVEKVEEIAGIFPIFFIVVAALVALTSMTRMVEEDRMQIGTFKALGYRNGRIMSKYMVYCSLASIIGCIVGILFGFSLLPSIFWKAYRSLYILPSLHLGFSPIFALVVFGISLAGTLIVTWGACRNSLKERPSALMQPKAPKPGKRILLERVGILWKPLKFKWKATIRNIFRYKKNMFLTILSVMGCTALILAGFGLSDSVDTVTDVQYSSVLQYDISVGYTGEIAQDSALETFLQEKDSLSLYTEDGSLRFRLKEDDANESVTLYVVKDDFLFRQFISLHTRKDQSSIDVMKAQKDGAIVLPENVALAYDVSVGDTLQYRSGGTTAELKVYAICEGYTGSNIYISQSGYETVFGSIPKDNTLLIKAENAKAQSEEYTKQLLSSEAVESVEFLYTSEDTFAGLSSTMGLVIAVLVISAGALAAIVLYNLTNINIDERRREIATLRVLGYRRREVAGYIYRESAILTIAGTLLGLGLGFLLHLFIVRRVSSVSMMFGRVIAGWSYVWAFLLTIAFAVIVYSFMLIKLNKINMAESLKSNE